MKKKDVPQDPSHLQDANTREICYAIDEDGKYVKVLSTGWKPKDLALRQALAFVDERADQVAERISNRQLSPIAYYLEKRMMDMKLLSKYARISRWRIKRHLKPHVFDKLSHKLLEKYADAFDISVEELLNH